jgi:hypothetical protein
VRHLLAACCLVDDQFFDLRIGRFVADGQVERQRDHAQEAAIIFGDDDGPAV